MLRATVVLILLALFGSGCGSGGAGGGDNGGAAKTSVVSPFTEVAQGAVADVRSGRARLLDVRTDEEVAAGRAIGSEHVSLQDLKRGERPTGRKDERIHVYCRTGRRAAEAVRILRRDGWTDVTNIGGLGDWEGAGGGVAR